MGINGAHEDGPGWVAALVKDTVIPRLVAEGKFGANVSLGRVEAAPVGGLNEDHWASTTLRVSLTLQTASRAERHESVIAKCMLPSDGFQGYNLPDAQAENEVNMYTKVFPFFGRLSTESTVDALFPKCFHAESGGPGGLLSLTLLQDLRPKGFRLAKERTALDKEHVSLALRALGRLHGHSHAAKALCRGEFLALAARLRECCYTADTQPRWSHVLRPPVMRGLKRLAERLQRDDHSPQDVLAERRRRLRRVEALVDDPFVVMAAAVGSQDADSSVIVHGDFCRNNMMFRYDDSSDRPVEVRLFDFQNPRYCSPSVDLAFFLFLNTSYSLRASHWDDLLGDYFGSLKSTLDSLLGGREVHEDFVEPTLQTVREDLKRHALWGFVICSFFLPQMLVPPEEMPDMEKVKEEAAKDPDAALKILLGVGGEEATNILADMLLEFLDRDLLPSG